MDIYGRRCLQAAYPILRAGPRAGRTGGPVTFTNLKLEDFDAIQTDTPTPPLPAASLSGRQNRCSPAL